MEHYARLRRTEWELADDLRAPTSALLPMGGAVSGVAGPNWMLIGDAAACVNPLNGEGIDYGLETGRLVAELITQDRTLDGGWPATLCSHYGEAFSIARRLAGLITLPRLLPLAGPLGMRSRTLMTVALRVMGNLVTESDRDLLVVMNGVSRVFDGRRVVDSIDLTVPRGTILGIIGPSGAGKTTTIRMLTGALRPTEGEVRVLGVEPRRFRRRDREKIGYMPQLFMLYEDLTAGENIDFVASLFGMLWRKRRQRVQEVLKVVDPAPVRDPASIQAALCEEALPAQP